MVVAGVVRQVHSAFGAQAWAIIPAHRLERQCSDYRVPKRRVEVDHLVLDQALFIISFFVSAPSPNRLGSFEEEHFLDIDIEVTLKRIKASAALTRPVDACGTRDEDSLVHGF